MKNLCKLGGAFASGWVLGAIGFTTWIIFKTTKNITGVALAMSEEEWQAATDALELGVYRFMVGDDDSN